jgi:hypothetical protein
MMRPKRRLSPGKAIGYLLASFALAFLFFVGAPVAYFAFLMLATQNRTVAMALGSHDVSFSVPDSEMTVTLRVAGSSPFGAAEYHRLLVVKLANGRLVEFPLGEDWGGIKALSVYTTGTHLRVLDCVTGFDIDIATGRETRLKDGYIEDAVQHLGSFVKGRGIEFSTTEPMAIKNISMSC